MPAHPPCRGEKLWCSAASTLLWTEAKRVNRRVSQQLHSRKTPESAVLRWQRGVSCSLAVGKSLFFLLGLAWPSQSARHQPKSWAIWYLEAPGFSIDSIYVHNRLRFLSPESFPVCFALDYPSPACCDGRWEGRQRSISRISWILI